MKRRLLSWTTAAIASAVLVVGVGAAGITYAATSATSPRTTQPEVEQTGQHEDPAGADQGPGQTGDNQGDHQDPGDGPDGPDAQDQETD
jgi:hypothetical protein